MADVEVISLAQSKQAASNKVLCSLFVQPFSTNNNDWTPKVGAFININGQRAWFSGTDVTKVRGVNTLVLDPYTAKLSDINNWNTKDDLVNSQNLATYINGLADGKILVGLTYDDPMPNLGWAFDTLTDCGVFIIDVLNGGNFAFVMQKGFPEKTQYVKSNNSSGIVWLNSSITGGDTPDTINIIDGPSLSCDIFVQPTSWIENANFERQAIVTVNKKRVFTLNYNNGFWYRRGTSTMILDPSTGTVSNITFYETCGVPADADKLTNMINSLPIGTILIVVTFDDAMTSLNQGAKNALASLGANVGDVQVCGNFAFVTQKGYPEKTIFTKCLTTNEANFIDVNISGVKCRELKFDYGSTVSNVRIEAASFSSDGSAKSTVWVNKKRVWQSASSSTQYQSRGITLMNLIPSSGYVYGAWTWDTNAKPEVSANLVSWINRTPKGAIMIGVTYDEPMASLSNDAKQALAGLGVSTDGVPTQGRFAFVAQKGYKERTQLVKSNDNRGTSVLDVCITGSTSPSLLITRT